METTILGESQQLFGGGPDGAEPSDVFIECVIWIAHIITVSMSTIAPLQEHAHQHGLTVIVRGVFVDRVQELLIRQ